MLTASPAASIAHLSLNYTYQMLLGIEALQRFILTGGIVCESGYASMHAGAYQGCKAVGLLIGRSLRGSSSSSSSSLSTPLLWWFHVLALMLLLGLLFGLLLYIGVAHCILG